MLEKTDMNRFRKTVESITTKELQMVFRRKISAIVVLIAVMMPTATPIPIWAYDLNLPPMVDDGLQLTSQGKSLQSSIGDFLSTLTTSPAMFLTTSGNEKNGKETANSVAALEKSVTEIRTELFEGNEVEIGQKVSLGARPVDKKGKIINGIAAKWSCTDSKVLRILNDSEAVAIAEGDARLIVRAGNVTREVKIKVNRGTRNSSKPGLLMPDPPEQPVITEHQIENLVTPENNLGNPIGQTEMGSPSAAAALRTRERFGSSNFSFSIPAASLPGRGIDASVGITYNSRIWNKSSSGGMDFYTFNTDGSWLAPGFEMGYGELT
ncbi:MAG: hypothetical protein HOP17_02625, partial [Acidobacteria bacterium]|nr:hypothetical protein [Acidobacteriota bacterium]